MKKLNIITILVTGFLFCVLLTAGCEEEQTPGLRQSKLIAEQNMELKKQIEKKDIEIARLKKELEDCELEKVVMQRKQNKEIESVGAGVMELFTENIKLKEELELLKKELEGVINN